MSEEKASDISSIKLSFPKDGISPKKLSRERNRVLKDLTKISHFKPSSNNNAPYSIKLSAKNNKLIFQIKDAAQDDLPTLILSLSPYKRIIKDYFLIIDSYEQFREHATASKLETIDMARRSIHNEAAEMMMDRLTDKITLDLETARGLFTLICVLHLGSVKSGWI